MTLLRLPPTSPRARLRVQHRKNGSPRTCTRPQRSMRRAVPVVLGFVALTIVLTFPQIRGLTASVPPHSDPYFSMWRLAWVAHAVFSNPRAVFDANIFFPEHDTLAYSDAMLLPGIVLAPVFRAGVPPVVIYSTTLLAAFALSGFTAFLLARELTEDVAASLYAGVIFAFAPYRFTHYAHLELQLVFWMPLALLLVHRILAAGGMRSGVLLGLVVGAQLLSCIYAAIFLVTYLVVFLPVLTFSSRPKVSARIIAPLAVAGILVVGLTLPYALAYRRAEARVGTRSLSELKLYSATTSNYLAAPAMNRLYGRTAITDPALVDEMNLFPGITAICLSLVGALRGHGRARFAYLAGLIFSIDLAAGANAFLYPWLFGHVSVFKALRSAARIDILITLSLALLAAYGAAFML